MAVAVLDSNGKNKISEETPLLALYKLSAQLRPEIEKLGGRLLKVVFEWEGREVTYSHDEQKWPSPPEVERQMSQPPPGAPRMNTPPQPVLAQTVNVCGFELPIPPVAKVLVETTKDKFAYTKIMHPKRTDPIDGIVPLTDEDICPIQKKYPNTKLKDVPADYLDWLYGQPWLRSRQPRLWAYIARHEDVITKELKTEGRV